MEYVELGLGLGMKAVALWVLWGVGTAVRATIRPPTVKELCDVRAALEKVQGKFDGLCSRLGDLPEVGDEDKNLRGLH